jgi:1-phosphatidylinositol-4-phosphate 5-kinase
VNHINQSPEIPTLVNGESVITFAGNGKLK